MDQPELPYQVKIENFEGPLDLLLHLIKKRNQHLRYSDRADRSIVFGLFVGDEGIKPRGRGEFLVMAATLAHQIPHAVASGRSCGG